MDLGVDIDLVAILTFLVLIGLWAGRVEVKCRGLQHQIADIKEDRREGRAILEDMRKEIAEVNRQLTGLCTNQQNIKDDTGELRSDMKDLLRNDHSHT